MSGLLPIVIAKKEDKALPGMVSLIGQLNTPKELILDNIRNNIRRQLPQLTSWQKQDTRVALACGGPSLKTNLKRLQKQVDSGFKLATVNGSHDFLQDLGFIPSIHMMVDARPFNARFVQRPIESCTYFIASQCHPDVFEALRDHKRVHIYHIDVGDKESETAKILGKYYFEKYITVVGGSTVTVNSLVLMHHLGFRYYDIYGFDSCFLNGKHHSYDQPENTEKPVRVVAKWGGQEKVFYCASWQIRQVYDFQMLIRAIPDDYFKCRVHGTGLIAHMMKAGCEINVTEEK